MRLRVTSVTAPDVGELINDVTTGLEDRLCPMFVEKDYGGGIQQFSVFYVSVDSDPVENLPYCQMHNRSGKYKDILSGKMLKYVGIAVPVDPELVLSLSRVDLQKSLQNLLLQQLETPAYQLPKKFDSQGFLNDLKAALASSS